MRPIVTKFCCSAALISLLSGCAELIAIEVATAVVNAATSGTERSSSNRTQKSDEVVTNNYEPEKSCTDSPSICTSEKLCDFATV